MITINTVDFEAAWKSVQRLNKPADHAPADQDLHCFLNRIYLGSGLSFESYIISASYCHPTQLCNFVTWMGRDQMAGKPTDLDLHYFLRRVYP